MTYTMKRYDSNIHSFFDADGRIVGHASRLSNGKWAVIDTKDTRIIANSFATPSDALNAFKAHLVDDVKRPG